MPRAPHTLLPRVLAAVQRWSRRPWYARAWLTWPLGRQVVSMLALLVLVVGSAVLLPSAWAAAGGAASPVAARVMSDVSGILQRVELTIHAVRVLWRALGEPLVAYAFALAALMCLACAAFGTALNRVVVERV